MFMFPRLEVIDFVEKQRVPTSHDGDHSLIRKIFDFSDYVTSVKFASARVNHIIVETQKGEVLNFKIDRLPSKKYVWRKVKGHS